MRTIYAPFGALTDEQWPHMAKHSSVRDSDGCYHQNYDPGIGQDFLLWPAMSDIVPWSDRDRVDCQILVPHGESSGQVRVTGEFLTREKAGAEAKRAWCRPCHRRHACSDHGCYPLGSHCISLQRRSTSCW